MKAIHNKEYNCNCCGSAVHDFSQYVQTRYAHHMQSNGFCYCCSYWTLLLADEFTEVCQDFVVYRNFSFMGGLDNSGVVMYQHLSSNTIHRTNNLWPITRIPEKLQKFFKPTITILNSPSSKLRVA
jgi:hypothetical protein